MSKVIAALDSHAILTNHLHVAAGVRYCPSLQYLDNPSLKSGFAHATGLRTRCVNPQSFVKVDATAPARSIVISAAPYPTPAPPPSGYCAVVLYHAPLSPSLAFRLVTQSGRRISILTSSTPPIVCLEYVQLQSRAPRCRILFSNHPGPRRV